MNVEVIVDGQVFVTGPVEKPKPSTLAGIVAFMNDEQQADFFETLGRLFQAWGPGKGDMQLSLIAGHMKTCECVTDAGRDFVKDLAGWLTR